MEEKLTHLYEELTYIRRYLIKKGPSGRTQKILKDKYLEAYYIYEEYNILYEEFRINIENKVFKEEEILFFTRLCEDIKEIYNKIEVLCSVKPDTKKNTMEKFELKTAIALLPIMTGDEEMTKQLINNIEMYEALLESDSKKKLINFVLKSRLSESAKMRLSQAYDSVTDLIKDMKEFLLTKQSDTAIQQQLQRARQHQLSIEDFGKSIEKMFVELTISQANGDTNKYKILKPINEKNAIKRFSDGLRNTRLSTIITARNYSSLKDAIRGALDEEMSSTSSEGVIMNYHRRNNGNFQRSSRRPTRGYAAYGRGGGFSRPPAASNQGNYAQGNFCRGNFRYQNQNSRVMNRPNRGTFPSRTFRQNRNHLNMVQRDDENNPSTSNSENKNHFFRA